MNRPKYNFERAAEIESSFTAAERQRLADLRHKVEVSLARQFPSLPSPLVAAHVRDSAVLNKKLYLNVVGAKGPEGGDLDDVVRQVVMEDELSRNALATADAVQIDAAKAEAFRTLSRARRIEMSRDGTLDDFLASAARQIVLPDSQREQVSP